MLAGKPNFKSLTVKAEQKCGSPGRDEMRKWTFTSLKVLIEQVRKRNLRYFEVLAEQECGEWNSTSLAVKAKRKCDIEALDLLKSWQSGNAKVELQSLAVKAGRKCRSGTSHL